MDEYRIDAKDLEHIGIRLREVAEQANREIAPTMLLIGEEVKQTAKAIIAVDSQKIPPTIRSRPIPGGVEIIGGSAEVPIGGLFEIGNKKSKRSSDTFRHPVFADKSKPRSEWTWVDQPKHPYLFAARLLLRREITRKLEEAWPKVLSRIGFERRY